jgi:putative transposase
VKINQAFRYELKPNNKQVGLLIKHCGVARFTWNWALARRIELYKTHKGKERFTSAITQQKELNALKKTEFPWMYEVSKCAPQSALQNLDRAFINFWREHKNGKNAGYPKFKKKGIHDSFKLTGSIYLLGKSVALPRLGKIRTKETTSKFKGRILSAAVSREVDRWFCSLCVEMERIEHQPIIGDIVGIDLGINSLAVISNGLEHTHIESPKPLKKRLKKLQRLSRQQSRKQLKSNNRKKANIALARCHRQIRNIRKDFLNKLTTSLTKTKSVICIEDLAVSNMVRNRHLARSIADVGWGDFRRMLEYKTAWYGSRLIKIPRFEPTSKMCHICGEINNNLKLSDRKWICLKCGTLHDRDENASDNVRNYGLKILSTESSSGSNACGVAVRLVEEQASDSEAGNKYILINGKTYGTDSERKVKWLK